MNLAKARAILEHAIRNRERAGQAVAEVSAWVVGGTPLADVEARRAVCEACEQWQALADGKTFHCAKCKCLAAKLAMATARCPLNKW